MHHPLARPALPHTTRRVHGLSDNMTIRSCGHSGAQQAHMARRRPLASAAAIGLAVACVIGVIAGFTTGSAAAARVGARVQATQELVVLLAAHAVRQTPDGRIAAGLDARRPSADHRRADHRAGDRALDRRRRLPLVAGDAPWSARWVNRLDLRTGHPRDGDRVGDRRRARGAARECLRRRSPRQKLRGGRRQALDADTHRAVLRRGDAADGRRRSPAALSRWRSAPAPTCCRNSKAGQGKSRFTDERTSAARSAAPPRMDASALPPRASTGLPGASRRARR